MLKFHWTCDCTQKNTSESGENFTLINGDSIQCMCGGCGRLKEVVFEIKVKN